MLRMEANCHAMRARASPFPCIVRDMKEPRFQLVAVDLMSTLVGSTEVMAQLLADTLDRAGLGVPSDELRSVVGLPVRRAVMALLRTGASLDDGARISERIIVQLESSLCRHFARPSPARQANEAAHILASLRAQGHRIAVVTTMPRAVVETVLAHAPWFERGLADTIVAASEVEEPRPQPGMIYEAMARTGVIAPSRVMKVGETPADLAEGMLARCGAVVALTSGVHSRDELLSRPHTHLADTLGSILDILALGDLAQRGIPVAPAVRAAALR